MRIVRVRGLVGREFNPPMILNSIRKIFMSFQTEEEERLYSRTAFFNLLGFLGSCVLFSFVAQRLSRHPREIAHIARANALIQAIQK